MTITALPALDRSSATFKTDVDNFFGSAIPQMVSEINADLEAVVYGGVAATQAEMESGTLPAVRAMSPLLVKQAIQATSPSEAVGTLKYSPVTPGAGWLRCDGASYLQSAFPELYGIVGLRPSGIPQPEAVNNNPFTTYVRGIAAVKDTFYVLGENGAFMHRYTRDGVTWANVTAFTVVYGAWAVAYNDILFVWPGSGNVLWYTKDECTTWTSVNVGYTPGSAQSLHYQGGRYFLNLAASPWLVTSTDLITWTPCTGISKGMPSPEDTYQGRGTSMVHKNGVWVFAPQSGTLYNTVWRSANGVTWTEQSAACCTTKYVERVWAVGDYFFATSGHTAPYTGHLSRSSDGIAWTNVAPGDMGSDALYAVGRVGWTYYAITAEKIYASDDGATWITLLNDFPKDSNNVITFIDGVGVFLADKFTTPQDALRFMSIVDGVPSGMQNLTTATASAASAGTHLVASPTWTYRRTFVRGNYIFIVPHDGPGNILWRTTDAALAGGIVSAGAGTDSIARPAMSRSRLMAYKSTTAAGSMVISQSIYGYDPATEFSTPVISSPIPNSYAWIKAV